MTDLQQSKLEREATNYAAEIGQLQNLELIRNAWERCAEWLIAYAKEHAPYPRSIDLNDLEDICGG